jgi:hypothetical protein
MSQNENFDTEHTPMPKPLDLSKWRNLPVQLLIGGLLVGLLGLAISYKGGGVNFLFSYLVAFMFILSLGAGSLVLVMIHHLFDAGWSVPLRRTCEIWPTRCLAFCRSFSFRSRSVRRRFIRGCR